MGLKLISQTWKKTRFILKNPMFYLVESYFYPMEEHILITWYQQPIIKEKIRDSTRSSINRHTTGGVQTVNWLPGPLVHAPSLFRHQSSAAMHRPGLGASWALGSGQMLLNEALGGNSSGRITETRLAVNKDKPVKSEKNQPFFTDIKWGMCGSKI